jgi:hypothetical protein
VVADVSLRYFCKMSIRKIQISTLRTYRMINYGYFGIPDESFRLVSGVLLINEKVIANWRCGDAA